MPFDVSGEARRRLRDQFRTGTILERCVRDIRHLLREEEANDTGEDHPLAENVVLLWDGSTRTVPGGANYAEDA